MKQRIIIAATAITLALSAPAFAQLSLGGHASVGSGVGLNAGGVVRGTTDTVNNVGAHVSADTNTTADIQGRAYGGIADDSSVDAQVNADARASEQADQPAPRKHHKHRVKPMAQQDAAATAKANANAAAGLGTSINTGANVNTGASLNTGTNANAGAHAGNSAGVTSSTEMRLNN